MNNFAGVIIKYKKSVLLGKRADNGCAYPGYWSIPAGLVESGEPFDACAERELYEETGITLKHPLTYLCDFQEKNGKFYVYLYESGDMEFPSTDAQDACEHTEWGYFQIDELSLPEPISKEIKKSILISKNDDR